MIKCSAINPDGHSICICYSDKVRFYRILLNKFKLFGEYSIKNAMIIHYSHGGQVLAIAHGKGLNSTLTLVSNLTLK